MLNPTPSQTDMLLTYSVSYAIDYGWTAADRMLNFLEDNWASLEPEQQHKVQNIIRNHQTYREDYGRKEERDRWIALSTRPISEPA